MKFVWSLFALLLVAACLSQQAAAAGVQTGICLRPGDSKTFKVGESWSTGPPSKCAKHTCKAPHKIVTVLVSCGCARYTCNSTTVRDGRPIFGNARSWPGGSKDRCGAFVIPEGCREVAGNPNAAYPACCPDIACSA